MSPVSHFLVTLLHCTVMSARGQQTFSARGQILNIQVLRVTDSLLYIVCLLNHAFKSWKPILAHGLHDSDAASRP